VVVVGWEASLPLSSSLSHFMFPATTPAVLPPVTEFVVTRRPWERREEQGRRRDGIPFGWTRFAE